MTIRILRKTFILCVVICIAAPQSTAQIDTTLTENFPELTITASRIASAKNDIPMAISAYQQGPVQSIRQQLSLQEYINDVPGLFSLNANNYAQDLRISIRGFGARASFGIRGIKIIVDGVPETTPDGQGQIDNLNLSIIDRIEIIRGPASSLYGNAAGGVINIKTVDQVEKPYFEVGASTGAYGMQQYQAEGGIKRNRTSFIGQGSYNKGNGYRENGGYKHWNFNGRMNHIFRDNSILNVNLNYANSPQADDPGGLDKETQALDRRAARDRNLLFGAGEQVSQFKTSVAYEKLWDNNNTLSLYSFAAVRDFLGFLPFGFRGVVDLERTYFGGGGHFTSKRLMTNAVNTFQVGLDFGSQDDDRMRYVNNDGVLGDLVSDQKEKFKSLGVYVLDHIDFGNVLVSAGIRLDRNAIDSESELAGAGPSTADLNYTSVNPSVGLSLDLGERSNGFVNYSRSFETPSLIELFADPQGGLGLNEDLQPQVANSFEMGIRGSQNQKWSYEAILYRISTKDDIVPFELEQQPDITFYRNAGKTKRQGLELSGGYLLGKNVNLSASYTFSDFTYEDFSTPNGDFAGNILPGIPRHFGTISLQSTENEGFIYNIQARLIGKLYAADDNQITDDGYSLVNVQIGYAFQTESGLIKPFLGVNNLFDVDYNDNVRINAFGGRHFEAGPPLHLFGGVKVRW